MRKRYKKFFLQLSLFKLTLVGVFSALLIRIVIYNNYYQGREVYLYSDNAIYAALSKRLLNGDILNLFHPYWNPGFPIFTTPFYLLVESWEKAQILVSMTSAVLLILVMFWFFRRFSLLFSFIVACLTAFSASLQKLVIVEGITEPLYILFLWLSIFLGWVTITTNKLRFYLLSGAFWALAYLVRTEAISLMALFLSIVVFMHLARYRTSGFIPTLKLILIRLGALLAIFFLLNSPYIIAQSIHLSKFTISGKYAFFGTGPPYALERDRVSTLAQDIWSIDFPNYHSPYYNSDRTIDLFSRFYKNGTLLDGSVKSIQSSLFQYKSINTDNFFVGFGLVFALVGFVCGLTVKKFRLLTVYLSSMWVVGFLWVNIFMAPHYRYLIFALPFFFYLNSLTIYLIARKIFETIAYLFPMKLGNSVGMLLSISVLALLIVKLFVDNIDINGFRVIPIRTQHKDQKIIGEWLKSQDIKLIGGRMEGVPFYAGAELVYMPSDSPEKIINYMKFWGVEYLLARPDEAGYEIVRPISRSEYNHPDLTKIHIFDDGSIVWKIKLSDSERQFNQRTLLKQN